MEIDKAQIIVVALSIVLSLATEFFFPIDSNDPIAVKQRHFWAAIFLIFSLVIGLPIEASFATKKAVEEAKDMLKRHGDQSLRAGRFEDLDTLYDKNFSSTDPLLKGWADETLGYIRERWSLGIMPLPRESAPAKIAGVYPEAHGSIIATNVGSTKFYFDVGTYAASNSNARNNGIPVVRFYLYSKHRRIELRGAREAKDIDDFFNEIKSLHSHLGSLYSAVINVDSKLGEHRDLLLMDNKFLAETVIDTEWVPIRAEATENDTQLRKARQYLRDVWGAIDTKYVVQMSAEDVRKYYSRNSSLPKPIRTGSAEALFKYLMNQIAGPL